MNSEWGWALRGTWRYTVHSRSKGDVVAGLCSAQTAWQAWVTCPREDLMCGNRHGVISRMFGMRTEGMGSCVGHVGKCLVGVAVNVIGGLLVERWM